jgi:hypothetical protein
LFTTGGWSGSSTGGYVEGKDPQENKTSIELFFQLAIDMKMIYLKEKVLSLGK